MHIALYRKYRPKTFSEVIGQKYVVSALKNQIAGGRIGHAFLFMGVRGTGKTTCAKIFAKAVNCLNPKDGEPCLECDICKGIDNESVYDVVEMDAASNNSVDDIRNILDEVSYLPVMAKYRVYIIDEVHMLTPSAFNALLKTLEEPPRHVIFILCTTDIQKVPATILSRCQRYDFAKLSFDEISDALLNIAKSENIKLTAPAAKMIASLADGAMRDANSILDTCLSVSGEVTEEVVSNITGVSRDDEIIDFAQKLIDKKTDEALLALRVLRQKSVDIRRLCEELINYFSNLLLCGMKGVTSRILNLPSEKFEKMKKQSLECSYGAIDNILKHLTDALDSITKGQSPKTALDIAVYKIGCADTSLQNSKPETAAPQRKVVSTFERENALRQKPTEARRQKPVAPSPETPVKQSEPPQKSLSKEEILKLMNTPQDDGRVSSDTRPVVFSNWDSVVDIIGRSDVPLQAFLKGSAAYLYQNVVYIKGSEALNDYIRSHREVYPVIKNAIAAVSGKTYNIGGYKNIASFFEKERHNSIDDVLALREKGVTVNIKD